MKFTSTASKYSSGPEAPLVRHQPWIHQFAFKYSEAGYRGSHLLWKVIFRLKVMPESTRVVLPNGFIVLTSGTDWNKNSIYKGQYERPLLQFLNLVESEDLSIDIGANIGITLWTLSSKAKSTSHSLALEPSPECFEELSWFASYKKIRGKVIQMAAGEDSGVLKLYGTTIHSNSGGATLLKRNDMEDDNVSVRVEPLDEILENEQLANTKISIVKIDTEGFEGQVLAGARKMLCNNPPDILILEVSPMFGDITYLEDLWEILSPNFDFFEMGEVGQVKRRAYLKKTDLNSTLVTPIQINLVVIRKSLVHKFNALTKFPFLSKLFSPSKRPAQ